MKNKLFLSTIFLCLGLVAKAEDTDVSQFENVVFPVSTSGEAGMNVTVSVEMNNTILATGFQFDIVLPEGITIATDEDGFYLIELSEERTTSKKTDFFSSALQSDGSVRVMCSSTNSYTFAGTSGEVCTIELNIGEDVADGDYPIIFKNIEISDADAIAYRVEQIEATLTVGAVNVNYDDGYSVRILPFLVSEETEGGKGTFLLTNATILTKVEFDVVLPTDIISNELYEIGAVSAKYKTNNELNGSTIHVSVAPRSSSTTIAICEDTGLATLGIYDFDNVIASGAHSITIRNIVLTDTDGTEYHAAPFTTYLIQDEYSRSMSYQWGTICLPYATQTTDDVQLYELSNVDLTAGVMSFSPVESLSANTPAIFKTTATNATFPVVEADEATDFVVSASTQADSWTAKGSFYDQELDPAFNASDIYYISGDKFYYANQTFAVGAFRAWFETSKSSGSMAPSFSISFDEEAEDLQIVEKSDGTVDVIYDLSGVRLQQKENGINIINGKKVMTR